MYWITQDRQAKGTNHPPVIMLWDRKPTLRAEARLWYHGKAFYTQITEKDAKKALGFKIKPSECHRVPASKVKHLFN